MSKDITKTEQDRKLLIAVANGQEKEAQTALLNGANANYVNSKTGHSLLYIAVKRAADTGKSGYEEIVRLLINAKADLNYHNSNGTTAPQTALQLAEYENINGRNKGTLGGIIAILKNPQAIITEDKPLTLLDSNFRLGKLDNEHFPKSKTENKDSSKESDDEDWVNVTSPDTTSAPSTSPNSTTGLAGVTQAVQNAEGR